MNEDILICKANHNNCEEAINYTWKMKDKESSMNLLNDERMFKNMSRYNIYDLTEIWFIAYVNNQVVGTISLTNNKINFIYYSEKKIELKLLKEAFNFICLNGFIDVEIDSKFNTIELSEYEKLNDKNPNIYKLRR